jgi:hypothetical protein
VTYEKFIDFQHSENMKMVKKLWQLFNLMIFFLVALLLENAAHFAFLGLGAEVL